MALWYCVFCLAALISAGCSPEKKESAVTFTSSVETDSATGWHVVRLASANPDDPAKNIAIAVVPEAGSNLFSFKVGGTELMDADSDIAKLPAGGRGCFIMFPSPNRIRDGVYEFMGEKYSMLAPDEAKSNKIHGLVRDKAWVFDQPVAGKDSVSFTAHYTFDETNPCLTLYPFPNKLAVTFTVMKDRVRVAYTVENTGDKPLGYGFGLHPFWRAEGGKAACRIQTDLPFHMEATPDLLPTGKIEDAKGSAFDLSLPRPVTELKLDDVYYGATPASEVNVFFDSMGLVLKQRATPDFTHVVVYTPDREYFCVENQTCSTDAHNLYAQGLTKESNLLTLDPGRSSGGFIDYIVEFTK